MLDCPLQIGDVPVIEMLGAAVNVTVTVVVAVHPATFVPVTLYVVVARGVDVTEVPVVADNPVAGDHAYVDAPLAVNVDDAPGQIEVGAAVAEITSCIGCVTVTEAVVVHECESVTVTV